MEKTSVLMVGGGLVGLSVAVFLAMRGIPAVLVERHPASSPLPRAMGFTTRTMELYRAAGLGDAIPQVPPGLGRPRRIKVESLADLGHLVSMTEADSVLRAEFERLFGPTVSGF